MSVKYWIEMKCPYCKAKFFDFYNQGLANLIECKECKKKFIVSMTFEFSKFSKVDKDKVKEWEE